MNFIKAFLLSICILQMGFSQEKVIFPYGKQVSDADKLKTENLQWNRYVSENFTVLSIDEKQGEWLYKNIENMKTWSLKRWGLPDFDPTKECRIFCVQRKDDLKKFFNLEEKRSEYRKDVAVIWFSFDEKPSQSIVPCLTENLLKDFSEKYDLNLEFWLITAISELNGNQEVLKNYFSKIPDFVQAGKPLYGVKYLSSFNADKYLKEDAERKMLFKTQSAILAIMLRKEFGQNQFLNYIKMRKNSDFESSIKKIYNYESISDFEKKYIKYMLDLTKDIKNNKVPDSYFDIKEVN